MRMLEYGLEYRLREHIIGGGGGFFLLFKVLAAPIFAFSAVRNHNIVIKFLQTNNGLKRKESL